MNGHGGRATSPRTGTRMEEGREGGFGRSKTQGGEKMASMKRSGKDERWKPCSVLTPPYHLWMGRNSQFPGWFETERWNEGRRRGCGLNHGRQPGKKTTTPPKKSPFQRILDFYQRFSLDVIAAPGRPIKVNDRELFSPQSSCKEDFKSVLKLVQNLFPTSTCSP